MDIYISSSSWFLSGALCASNVTVTSTLRPVLVMCANTVTDARYVTVAKNINSGRKYFVYAEVQPLRKGECCLMRRAHAPHRPQCLVCALLVAAHSCTRGRVLCAH